MAQTIRIRQMGTPDSQIRWLIQLSEKEDLSQFSDEAWEGLREQLAFLVGRAQGVLPSAQSLGWPGGATARWRAEAAEAQAELRRCLTALAYRHPFECYALAGSWHIVPVEAGKRRQRKRGRPAKARTRGSHSRLHKYFSGRLSAALVLAAVDLLDRAGPERLMACPFTPHSGTQPCGRLFLAIRRQLFCSTRHSKKKSSLEWERRRKQEGRARRRKRPRTRATR